MISRLVRLCSGFALIGISHLLAQAPAPLPQNPAPAKGTVIMAPATAIPANAAAATKGNDDLVSLNLPDADIDTVLSTLEMFTGKIILRPAALPPTQGGFNLKIKKQIPRSEAVLYLETILSMNQIAVIPMGPDALKVIALTQSRVEAPQLIDGSTLGIAPSSAVAAKLFQLNFLRAQEFQTMIQNITNPSIGGVVPLPNANALLITDTISNLQRIETLQDQVDKPAMGGLATKFYPLRNGAKASDLVGKLRTILTGTIQTQLGMGTSYNADDRTNQIILITDPRQFPFFDDLIAKLDVKADPNTRNEVIYLKHAKAADVVTVLGNIIRGQSAATQRSQSARPTQTPLQPTTPTPPSPLGQPAAPPQPTLVSASGAANTNLDQGSVNEFSSLVTVANDDRSNSVIVSGTLDDIRLIQELIDKLDIVLAQVRIEVVIAEVTLDDNHESGIGTLGLKLEGDRLVGFAGNASGISIGGADGAAGSLATISRIGGPGSLARSLDLSALISLNTTKRKNNTTILTVPAIVTSHGKQAVINDGETRPVISGVTSYAASTGGVPSTSSQVSQQQIGTTLTVTPFIGNDGTVQLDIQQELTDVTDKVLVDNNTQYVIGTRKANSYVTARSGEIHVLGGFRKKINTRQTSRLGPIPIIGDLLGARTKDNSYQELIFFLRPTILSEQSETVNNAETMERVNKLPTKDEIKGELDPRYVPEKSKHPVLDKILPK